MEVDRKPMTLLFVRDTEIQGLHQVKRVVDTRMPWTRCFSRVLILHLLGGSSSQEITGQEVCVYVGEGWEEGEPAILYYILGGAIFTS